MRLGDAEVRNRSRASKNRDTHAAVSALASNTHAGGAPPTPTSAASAVTTDNVIVPAGRSSGPVSHCTEYVAVSPTRNGTGPGGGGAATSSSSSAASLASVQTTS